MSTELIYLNDDIDAVVERVLSDKELADCGLGKQKVLRTLKAFQGDEIATSVFYKKYALRDDDNKIIEFTLEEARDRWAKEISSAERMFDGENVKKKNSTYFKNLYEHFLPAGRQMFALGNDYIERAILSDCDGLTVEQPSRGNLDINDVRESDYFFA